MRVMVFVKSTKDAEDGLFPNQKEIMEAMGRYNEELVKAGILEFTTFPCDALGGLKPTKEGKRVAFDGAQRTVMDGPFPNPNEIVAGYWIWTVKDMDEAVEWVKRCPNPMPRPSEIEIRPFYEMEDFA